jgi:hypothetical protein
MTEDFIDRYGNPDIDGDGILDLQWFADNISIFSLPFPVVQSWMPYSKITRFQAHRLAGNRIIEAMKRVMSAKGYDYLVSNKLDRWGGCFNFRLVRGGDRLSNHSWGTSVDFNPDIGRLGNAEDAKRYPSFIIQAFEAEGFVWGGKWQRPDAMHFELQA